MAFKILTLDLRLPDGVTPAAGTRVTVSVDRDVSIKGGGVIAKKGAVTEYDIPTDGTFPSHQVIPNDDPSLSDASQGYGLIVEAEPTPSGGVSGGPWTVVITTATANAVNLGDLDFHNVIGLPPNISLGDTMARLSTVEGVAADAKSSAADSATSAAQSLDAVQGIQSDVDASANAAAQSAADASASAALVGAPAGTAISAYLAPFQIRATDHGVQAGTSTDQTSNMQAALDAAATTGADLLLPSGVIKMTGQLVWQSHTHSIVGTQSTSLDWSSATFDGPGLTVEGDRNPAQWPASVATARLSKVTFNGPTATDTTVDGILFEGDTSPATYGVTLDQVTVAGFRHAEVYGDQTWLIHHSDYNASKYVDAAIYWTGSTNCGENIRYSDGSFANGSKVVDVPGGAQITMFFDGVSFDYNTGPVVTAASGRFTFSGCHIEYTRPTTGPFPVTFDLTSNQTGFEQPTLTLLGGHLLLTRKGNLATVAEDLTIVRTTTTYNQPPIVVTSDGMSVRNRLTDGVQEKGVLNFHRETNTTDLPPTKEWAQSYPRILFRGNLDYEGTSTHTRLGYWASILRDGDMSSTTAWPTSWSFTDGTGVGWCAMDTAVTRDTTTKPAGVTASAKINLTSAASGGYKLMQPIAVTQRTTLHVGFKVKTSGFTAGSVCSMAGYFLDAAGKQIVGAETILDLKSRVGSDDDWTWYGGWLMVPNGAVVAQLNPRLNGSTGTIWFADLTVSAI